MRRIALVLALLAAILIPGSVAARADRCSVQITPSTGSPTDVYRIAVSNVPVDSAGGSLEVQVDIHRLGTREGSVYWAFLVPGVTEFFIDHNYSYPEEPPADPLAFGRYLVSVTTPHISGPEGCHAVGQFVVI